MTLGDTAANFTPGGGTGTIDVQTSSGQCAWSATTEAAWITIRAGSNRQGNGSVSFDVAPTTGPPRAGTITAAGLQFSVTQSQGCSYAIAPSSFPVSPSGGSATIAVSTGTGCPWTAGSNASWIAVTQGATGTGPGSVAFTVAPTSGPARSSTMLVAGQTVTVTQSAGCIYSVTPTTHSIPSTGGNASVTVDVAAGCGWSASTTFPWITVTSGVSGAGSGTVAFTVAATTGPARTGTLTIAGEQVTVNQGQGCSVSISPDNQSVPASGGTGTVTVTTAAGCPWTSTSNAPWLTINSGATGTGPGTVQFTAASTSGSARTGTLTIGGRTFTVNQGQGCSYSIAPQSQSVPSTGGNGTVNVTAANGCAWTATSNSLPWLTITGNSSGSGNGSVNFAAASTTGGARSGTLTIAGQTFTVNQGASCAYTLAPSSVTVPAAGVSNSPFDVQTTSGCAWTATPAANSPWITIASGASGNSTGTVRFNAAANTGPQRVGTITAGGQTFTVTQSSGCSYSLSSTSQSLPVTGGSGSVNVITTSACTWAATSGASWLTIQSGTPGTGNGTVQFTAAGNVGGPRSGTLTIAGLTFTVNEAACVYTISPQQQNVGRNGGTNVVTVNVTTSGTCMWTATSNDSWITIGSGSPGTGNGQVRLTVAANATGRSRTGTVTIAGQTFTVTQDQ